MGRPIVVGDNIISSLGFSTNENWGMIFNGETGIASHNTFNAIEPVYASLVNSTELERLFQNLNPTQPYTRFEKLIILSISRATENIELDIKDKKTAIILSSTKGNIDLLDDDQDFDKSRVYLSETAKAVQQFFGNPNTSLVISNACISGILAILVAARLIKAGRYENVIVSGADIISQFVVSGFQSLKALSDEPCRPFDKNRKGLNLGEGCGTIILSGNKKYDGVEILAGASSNDANHISGPSRDGQGLFLTIQNILRDVGQHNFDDLGYISAHGTATLYNDEMEAHAISRSGLGHVPTNSLKGYFGHTLGAAGVIESILSVNALKKNVLIKSLGFGEQGVSKRVNIITETKEEELKTCLKLGSGFGGCNAGILFTNRGK